MLKRTSIILVLGSGLLLAAPAWAQNSIDRFIGNFVGSGTAERRGETTIEQRDLDVSIAAYKRTGFTIKWTTVIRGPQGERAGADVRRREVEEDFVLSEDLENIFILAPRGGMFTRAKLPNPLEGDPMRWASVAGDTLTIYSLGIAAEGHAEFQIYHRTLTETGLKSHFLRMQDEVVVVQATGELTRTE